ncbi:MAG: GNAT family N-acetyltransferase [Thermoanaerobaculia bacterium]|nr:GNAT family N-acetyltransferase [Thermoanaerobaculia bacterium]
MTYSIRLATADDIPSIERVMRESMETIGRFAYDDRQVASSVRYITTADHQLIDDETYFVAVADERVVACGGWSRRAKLYTGTSEQEGEGKSRALDPKTEPARIRAMFVEGAWGRRGIGQAILAASEAAAIAYGFRRFELMALLPGEPLYAKAGYRVRERSHIELPDGVKLETAVMVKEV